MRKQNSFQTGCKKALEEKQQKIESFSTRIDDLKVTLLHIKELLNERYSAN